MEAAASAEPRQEETAAAEAAEDGAEAAEGAEEAEAAEADGGQRAKGRGAAAESGQERGGRHLGREAASSAHAREDGDSSAHVQSWERVRMREFSSNRSPSYSACAVRFRFQLPNRARAPVGGAKRKRRQTWSNQRAIRLL